MKLTKEQQEEWIDEYTKYAVMTKLADDDDDGKKYYDKVDFDGYAAYEYLGKRCDFREHYYVWIIGDMKIIIDIEQEDINCLSAYNSSADLVNRKKYLETRVKVPKGLTEKEREFKGLMYLAKVLGCNPGFNNWNNMGDIQNFRDSLLVSRFPINKKRNFVVMKIDATFDDDLHGVGILH
jgi:hypothetical protein